MKKYSVPYQMPDNVKVAHCRFCKQPLIEGQMVVNKCNHIVHRTCWDQNNGRCSDYPRCKDGEHYYNKERKSDPKNAIPHMPWIVAGLVAGLLSWLMFNLLCSTDMFSSLSTMIATKIMDPEKINDELILSTMVAKIRPMLICGIPIGFFLALAFSYVIEFKKKDLRTWLFILLRAAIGAILGFLSFFLGVLIIVALGKQYTEWIVDWIPWLFFALTMSFVIWFKTEIVLKTALIGGAVSVLLCFILLLTLTSPITSMFCYMIYASGFGAAIAVVHYSSQLYFLHIEGEGISHNVAIYKWMSVSGGLKTVSIGSSPNCTLWMNWVDADTVPKKAAELYLDNGHPCMRVLDRGVSYQGRTLQNDRVVSLRDGMRFNIANTSFTYMEK